MSGPISPINPIFGVVGGALSALSASVAFAAIQPQEATAWMMFCASSVYTAFYVADFVLAKIDKWRTRRLQPVRNEVKAK